MLRSLTRNVATYASLSTIAHDTGADGDPIRRETVAGYLDALTRLMVVEDQPAWQPHLRSKADAIVRRPGGPWAAFEVKLGGRQIDQAARTLLRFAERIDTSRIGEPAALGVIVGTGYGYTRPDGISVIPIGALGP